MTNTKFCKDCRFVSREGSTPFTWLCTREKSVRPPRTDLVTGEVQPPEQMSCHETRSFRENCGQAGQYWEPLT